MSTAIHAYRFALDPTCGQDGTLRSHCGGQRFAFNWALAAVTANLDQRTAERSYGIDDPDLTPALGCRPGEPRAGPPRSDTHHRGRRGPERRRDVCNRRLARHVAGVGMAEFRRQIECKADWSGTGVQVADRW